MQRTQSIAGIRKQYPKEWLAIKVAKMDPFTTTALTGRLLAHSRDRDEILLKSMKYKGLIYIGHASAGTLPKGYAVAF